jgi:hypothetical protein
MDRAMIAELAAHAPDEPYEYCPVAPTGFDDTARAVMDLHYGDCRWPIGEVKQPGFRFCGETAVRSSSYCKEHHRLSINLDGPSSQGHSYVKWSKHGG